MKAELAAILFAVSMCWSCASTPNAPPLVEQHHRLPLTDGELAHLMVTHHRIVKDVALVEIGSGKSSELREFATAIWEDRHRDLPVWQQFEKLAAKRSDVASTHEQEMIAAHRATLARLKATKSAELDKLFLQELLRLNQSALDMIEQAQLSDPAVKQLAERFAQAQRGEMQQVNQRAAADTARGR